MLVSVSSTEPRDPLTGLLRLWRPDTPDAESGLTHFAPELATPWLAPLPGDAVFLLFDLRRFGLVNYEHGHCFGDAFLGEIGSRLREAARPWPAYRYGGDGFLVAARASTDADVHTLASSIRAALERPYHGTAVGTWAAAARAFPGESPEQLLNVLERAMATVTENEWNDLLIAPPEADEAGWFEMLGS